MHETETGTARDLARYRLQKAMENLQEAKHLYEVSLYSGANNRIYYSVFNAILAVHALDERVTNSHKRAIGEFNRIYIHGGDFPKEYSKEITKIEMVRHSSDYDNFYTADADETKNNYDFAEQFLSDAERYCENRMKMDSSDVHDTINLKFPSICCHYIC